MTLPKFSPGAIKRKSPVNLLVDEAGEGEETWARVSSCVKTM